MLRAGNGESQIRWRVANRGHIVRRNGQGTAVEEGGSLALTDQGTLEDRGVPGI